MFMNLGNQIKGEAEDVNHKDWCEITEFKHTFSHKVPPMKPDAQQTVDPKPKHSDVTISKFIDSATTEILTAVWKGTRLPKVIIKCLRASGSNDPVSYLQVELDDVIISKYNLKTGSGDLPEEELELTYATVKYIYDPIDKYTGRPQGIKFASHDRNTNKVT